MKNIKIPFHLLHAITFAFVILISSCSDNEDVESVKVFPENNLTVITKPANYISLTTAITGGGFKNLTEFPVTAKGICWSLSPNPTTLLETKTIETLDDFDYTMTGLKENTTYYVRAYATNILGTVYGNEISFKTNIYTKLFTEGNGVTDIENNEYKTIIIDATTKVDTVIKRVKKEWMAENLRTTKYNNGEAIDTLDGFWKSKDPNNVKLHGVYYNWLAVNDARKICPEGWHIPTKSDWEELRMTLDLNGTDNLNNAGIKLKSRGTVEQGNGLWKTDSKTQTTNEAGFNVLPSSTYDFKNKKLLTEIGYESALWTSTSRSKISIYMMFLANYSDIFNLQYAVIGEKDDKDKRIVSQLGLSCRCVKN